MAQAYYRKFRPQLWDEVVGQDHVIHTLRNALEKGNISHAYLFSGPRGTGKTTTARIIAKSVNCLADEQNTRPCNICDHCQEIDQGHFLDLIEIDAASNTSVDDVRDLRERINFLPSRGRFKVYIIDEVHMLSNAAFNALLKTLEEPPTHAIFILATTEVHKIPATVISRCQRHEFRRIPLNFIQALLKEIADREEIKIEPNAVTAIARQATGSMRDAVSLLDQLASTGSDVTLELTQQVLGTSTGLNVLDLIEALLTQDVGEGIKIINNALDRGSDPRQFGRQVVDALRAVLMMKMGNAEQVEINLEEMEKIKDFADRFTLERLLSAINCFDRAAQFSGVGWQPGLQLELALTRSITSLQVYDDRHNDCVDKVPKSREKPINQSTSTIKADNVRLETQKKEQIDHLSEDSSIKKEEHKKPQNKSEISSTIENLNTSRPSNENGDLDIEKIRNQWKEIRAEAKSISPETAALLNSTRNMEMRNNKLVLSFSSLLLSSKMENGKNLENAQKAIKTATGLDVEIVSRVAGKNENSVPDDLQIQQDGMVGTAISLGGKIIKKES